MESIEAALWGSSLAGVVIVIGFLLGALWANR